MMGDSIKLDLPLSPMVTYWRELSDDQYRFVDAMLSDEAHRNELAGRTDRANALAAAVMVLDEARGVNVTKILMAMRERKARQPDPVDAARAKSPA